MFCDVPCFIKAVNPPQVILDSPVPLGSGMLTQSCTACTPDELSYAFEQFWGPLWNRDGPNLTMADWADFEDTLKAAPVPPLALNIDVFQDELWVAAARHLSPRKAVGVCGWSPADLRLLPKRALTQLSRIFKAASCHGLPDSILQARVCVLSKTEDPTHIRQSRPIVVFSVLYRLWASICSRLTLARWSEVFPAAVAGSLPQRSASDITFELQHELELSLLSRSPALGFSIDIVKCFNQIGWAPVIRLMRTLGFPSDALALWEQVLPRVCRYPSFQGCLGAGIRAKNGSPQGDPISVAAMATLCLAASEFFRTTGAVFATFVDNWSWRSTCPDVIAATLPKVLHWLRAAKLPVDWAKSYAWAANRSHRNWWKSVVPDLLPAGSTLQVVASVKELGTAFQFGSKPEVACRDARVVDATARLHRIKAMGRGVRESAQLIQRSAWPAILHGLEGHLLPMATFSKLRGLAARAMVGYHATLSPHLALSAITTLVQDPQLYCLLRQLHLLRRTFRRDPGLFFSVLKLASLPPQKHVMGPGTAIAGALCRLGASVDESGILKFADNGRVALEFCTKRQLDEAVTRTWSLCVQDVVKYRTGLATAGPPSARVTHAVFQQLNGSEAAVFSRHVCGGFVSGAAKAKWADDADGKCCLCGAVDDKRHRLLHCPATEHVRAPWRPYLEVVLDKHPHWVHGPYGTEAPHVEVPRLIFVTRSLPRVPHPAPHLFALPKEGVLHLFTDGSCRHPSFSAASIAAYAVVQDLCPDQATVPHLRQEWSVSGRIWTDSAFVVAEWNRGRDGHDFHYPDLGLYLTQSWRRNFQLRKIKAHADLSQVCGVDWWRTAGNIQADLAAKAAVRSDFGFLLQLVDDIADYEATQRDLLLLFACYLVALSKEESILKQIAVRRQSDGDVQQARGPSGQPDSTVTEQWLQLQPLPPWKPRLPGWQRDWILAASWPPWFSVSLWGWATTLSWPECQPTKGQAQGITYLELVVNFVAVTKLVPPSGWTTSCLVRAKAWRIDQGVPGMLHSASWTPSDNSNDSVGSDCCLRAVERCMDYEFLASRSLE